MLDLSHILNSQQDIQIFYASEGTRSYQTWRKPKKSSFVYILSVDGGGGGGSGYSSTSGSTGFATVCGGGSGGVTKALINSGFVPDILHIKVGKGGLGGNSMAAGAGFSTGAVGESSGVFCSPNAASQVNANQSSSFLGGASSAAGGAAGLGNGVLGSGTSTLGNNFLLGLTNIVALGGRASSGGGVGGSGTNNIDPLVSHIVTAGAAGAGYSSPTAFDGSSINASSISPLVAGGLGGGLIGGNGDNGFTSWKPFFSTGGAGGGNSFTPGGQAGNGGNGGIGSGGGAGGCSNFGISGKGGDGGDGIVIIISF